MAKFLKKSEIEPIRSKKWVLISFNIKRISKKQFSLLDLPSLADELGEIEKKCQLGAVLCCFVQISRILSSIPGK